MDMVGSGSGSGMASPPSNSSSSGMMHGIRHQMMMHMSFFWGKNAEILFHQWPGDNTGMYVLALVFVFVMSLLLEWLSHSHLIKSKSNSFLAGLIQSLLHLIRVGLAYMVMLAIMSFNVGVFLVALAGHTLGFFFFASRAFNKGFIEDLCESPSHYKELAHSEI